ncbi:CPBP family intramembrane glutamic endopeptidase [Lacticaseibacillus saniviri]|uniref:CAAX prenyl protease 2/Lysostaphin resistance protein A-like domain-containing protein n=1 Tax=Lacticaseibacillus saniviri JCM 17471 = DSM 24301 TaxID=1293598 RepID=A0A0R2MRM0_9LACO|nr:type II CAAX endopeptidase family protein [Lacticaseibacillus saniviri]KRO16245.1 hypothetical protein IV56_GL001606 [Lacticaseibacillus saniviri JCM 17471 = DSM 24301]MCG4282374.1 CPBP family intramembrane metalloprotease [Lacticaseibacillus saniviri]
MPDWLTWLYDRAKALIIFAAAIMLVEAYQWPLLFAASASKQSLWRRDWFLLLTLGLTAIAVILLLRFVYRRQLKQHNPLNIHRQPMTSTRFFFMFFMYILVLAVNVLVSRFGTPGNQQSLNQISSIWPYTLAIMAAVFAPFIEEFVFRGLFMNLFWNKDNSLNNVLAVVTSGLAFGWLHEPRISVFLLVYASMGMALAAAYRYNRDLRYSIGLHMTINLIPAIAMLLR